MTGNVNSINAAQRQRFNPSQSWANSYATLAMNDGSDDFMGTNPIGGAAFMNGNDSIYGNSFNQGFGGAGAFPSFGGCGGYGPGSETMNMTQEQYMQYQEKLENYQIDKQVRQQHKVAAAGFQQSAADDAVTRQVAILQRKIHENEQDSVMTEYNKLLTNVETKLLEGGYIQQGASKDQVKAYAEKLYLQSTGKSVADDLAEHGDSSFVHGMKKGAFAGLGSLFANNSDYEDNISSITGEAKNSTSETWKTVGVGTSAIVTTGAVLAGRKQIWNGLKYIATALLKGVR